MKSSRLKGRTLHTYTIKAKKITDWYNHLKKERDTGEKINKNTNTPTKRKPLKDLKYYLDKLKKASKKE